MPHSDGYERARSEVRLIRVPDDRAGQRLDNFLLLQLKGAPKSLIYKVIRSGQVRINGARVKAERRLDAGDEVRIPPIRLRIATTPSAHPPQGLLDVLAASVIYQDARLLAINKPAGIASHGGSGIGFGAIEVLRLLYPDEKLDLVHRLDRDTSGLMLVARKRSALTELQALMRGSQMGADQVVATSRRTGRTGKAQADAAPGMVKRYLALLIGRMPDGVMHVDAPLHVGLRSGGERHVQVVDRRSSAGKPAMSHFRLLERLGGQSYCEVQIDTGRTHQIRVHAQSLGHPLAGDSKYGDPATNARLRDRTGLKRLFLHAASLEFSLDHGETPYLLNAPLAPELGAVLDRL